MSTPPFLTLPDGVRARRVMSARGEFAVLKADPTDADETVLLVPGWTGSKEDFLALLAPLAARGYRVVALDQRGQFETPGFPDESAYTLDALAADLLTVAGELGFGPVHVVGHSFGGLVARAATIHSPEAVASLTLMGSGPAALPVERHSLLQAMASAITSLGMVTTWQAKQAHERASGVLPASAEIERFLERRFLANHPTSLRAMTLLLTTAVDEVAALTATSVPTLVTCGIDDDVWPVAAQQEMAARLNAPAVVIDDAGHSPASDQPEHTAAVLAQFWTSIGARQVDV